MPIFLFHLLEFMDVDDGTTWSRSRCAGQDYDEWNESILKWPGDDVEIIEQAPASGIGRMDENGKIGFVAGCSIGRMIGENEALTCASTLSAINRYHGAEIGILVVLLRMQTDDLKLHEAAKRPPASMVNSSARPWRRKSWCISGTRRRRNTYRGCCG